VPLGQAAAAAAAGGAAGTAAWQGSSPVMQPNPDPSEPDNTHPDWEDDHRLRWD